ncbi:MAG TPA: isoprenylcysteine carboxylmethyltransferase family protein [Anaerolineales bacterium]|nr:isoprenylcysteine carboxylmethyltransferase family protein [Anaerolineales bacterium]
MTLYIMILVLVPTIWIAFEIGLVIRDKARGKGKTADDRGTRIFNFLAIAVGIAAAAGLNGVAQFFFPGGRTAAGFAAGVAIMLIGMALRYWAVFTLGASFRTTIETDRDQKVVSSGPYRLIRHPSYAGWLLICFGYGFAMQNWLSLLAAVLFPLIALLYRIRVEEKALAASLGAEYVEFQKRTKKLIPWVW